MASKNIAVTLRPDEIAFLRDKNLSPTQLLKEKIHEIMALSVHTEVLLREQTRKCNAWMETAEKFRIFIEEQGLTDKYLNKAQGTKI